MFKAILDDGKSGFDQLLVYYQRVLAAHQHDLRNFIVCSTNGLDQDVGFLGQELADFIRWTVRETRGKLKVAGAGHPDAREFDDTLLLQLDRVGVYDAFDLVVFESLFDGVDLCFAVSSGERRRRERMIAGAWWLNLVLLRKQGEEQDSGPLVMSAREVGILIAPIVVHVPCFRKYCPMRFRRYRWHCVGIWYQAIGNVVGRKYQKDETCQAQSLYYCHQLVHCVDIDPSPVDFVKCERCQ